MGGISLRVWTTVIALFAWAWVANAHDKSFVEKGPVVAAAFKTMTLPELLQIEAELDQLWGALKKVVRPKTDIAKELPLLKRYAEYETIESVHAVMGRLTAELRREESAISIELVESCLNVLGEIMTTKPEWQLSELLKARDLAERQFTTAPNKRTLAIFDHYIMEINNRNEMLYSVREQIEAIKSKPDHLKQTLDAMEDRLNKHILGQPELVDAFMAMEWNNQLYKNSRLLPDFVYLMGLPGTGKDTGAEAFTDALWEKDGANAEHMFRLPIMKGPPELWQVLGSSTGYVGSDAFPPFLEFLVKHSGGRYLMQKVEGPKPAWRVIENTEWKGQNLPGYWTPDRAVVFANELHNWSKSNKDILLKQALEKGYFTINNPNGGVAQMYVPVRFVMASNEGIPLLTAREANGQRFGKPLNYDQMLEKWTIVHNNKDALKNEILSTNGAANSKGNSESATGTSEEMLNRLQPDRFLLLLRPLSPETLQKIAQGRLEGIQARLKFDSGFFKTVELSWDPSIVPFIQEYDYMPENNARPIKGNVETLIEETLLRALRDGDIQMETEKKNVVIRLGIKTNEDQTSSLIINYSEAGKKPRTIVKLIEKTTKDRPAPPLSDEQIRKLSTLAGRLKQRVFGIDIIADRISDRVLAIENQRTADSEESRRVNTIVALGLSSTGKTELAKALAAEVLGDEKDLVTFDFSQIQTMHDFKSRILGLRDAQGNAIKSDFMKAYDRANGKLFVAFDELANVRDPELLTALYDFFREPIVSTFSDGIPRKMGGVMVLVTGNAGQELYQNVPRDLPMEQQMAAWQDISEHVALDSELQRKILERYFPAPLITRWSKNNIFFFPPHTFRSLRQLAQMKLEKELKRISNTQSRRGWNVVVADTAEYSRLIDAIVEEGFSLRYQGASIDSFILEDLGESLESVLLKNMVASGSTVVMKYIDKTPNHDKDKPGYVNFKLFVDGQPEAIDFKFKRPYVATPIKENETQQRITAYHEAAHSIMRQIFFSETSTPGLISIIPGVAEINDEWVPYAGIAHSEITGHDRQDRDYFLRQIAILAAGESAERLVTRGQSHAAGKSNDMKRATQLAQAAIIRFGLSAAWGTRAVPDGMSITEYFASLSEKDKELLNSETAKMVEEGRQLALAYLEANFDNALIPLGNLLIEKGRVEAEELKDFYARVRLNRNTGSTKPSNVINAVKRFFSKSQPANGDWRLRTDFKSADKVANISEIVESLKRKQFESVPIPENPPVGSNASYETWAKRNSDCASLLVKRAG